MSGGSSSGLGIVGFFAIMAYDADVRDALKNVELDEEEAISLATKLKSKKVSLNLIAGLSNDNVTQITAVLIEQVPS